MSQAHHSSQPALPPAEKLAGADTSGAIAFQGEPGAYSHKAAKRRFPDHQVLPCHSFDEALDAVSSGLAVAAMIPIENSTAGRVADIHMLLPDSGLYIVAEQFEPIRHALLALPEANPDAFTSAISHVQALGQCRRALMARGLDPISFADTAGAARYVKEKNDPSLLAIASELAADVYGLEVVARDLQDEGHNTTRFVVLGTEPLTRDYLLSLQRDGAPVPVMTSLTFEVKNVPAALFKALGGFATNGVNMTKLESYYDSESFTATEFYAEIAGMPGDPAVDRALDELLYHAKKMTILGSYPQARRRLENS